MPGDPALAAVKHPPLPAVTGSAMKRYVSREDVHPAKEVHPAVETCSRAPAEVGHVESRKRSQIQPPPCPFSEGVRGGSLMDGWCHLLSRAGVTSRVSHRHPSHLCLFPPPLGAAFGVQKAPCCCHGELRCHRFVTVVGHGSALTLGTTQDMGFMFTAFNGAQTLQSRPGDGCPPRVR